MEEFNPQEIAQLELNRNSDKLSNLIDEWDKKIVSSDATLQVVETNHNTLQKELVTLRNELAQKRKEELDSESIVRKANHNIRTLKSQKSIIERAFWRSK